MATKNKLLLQNQSGAALVIALMILIVLTVISLSSSLTSITEIKLSGNKRGSTDAFYTADGGVQATIANLSNFVASTYIPIPADTSGISPDILNQGVDSFLPNGSVTFPSGATFTTPPTVVIYHETNTGAPRGLPFSAGGSFGFEYYIIRSTGVDQTSTDLLKSTSQVVTTAVRIMPSAQGGN